MDHAAVGALAADDRGDARRFDAMKMAEGRLSAWQAAFRIDGL
jgi:hypothetical protein